MPKDSLIEPFAGFFTKEFLNQSRFFDPLCSLDSQKRTLVSAQAVGLSFYEQKFPEVFLNKIFKPLCSSGQNEQWPEKLLLVKSCGELFYKT